MVNILMLMLTTIIVTFVGGGVGYLIWLKTRPKKETWSAKVYQLSEGVRKSLKDGSKVTLTLQDLKPYALDTLEKVEKKDGSVIYRLQKLNKTTPAVESDVVEYWGKDRKEVAVLFVKSGCTLLKKGYDKVGGEMIFDPLPHSRINLIKGEMSIRQDRLQKEKDVLQAITPWIVVGISMFGLIAIVYAMITGFIEISENLKDASLGACERLVSADPLVGGFKIASNPVGIVNNSLGGVG